MSELFAKVKYGAILSALVIVLSILVIWPTYKNRVALDYEISELQSRVSQSEVDHELMESANVRLTDYRNQIEYEMKPIPTGAEFPSLIMSISNDISDLPLEGGNVTRGKERTNESLFSLSLMIETSGQFDSAFELLTRIENLQRLVRVNEVEIEVLDKSGSGAVNASITLEAFYQNTQRAIDP